MAFPSIVADPFRIRSYVQDFDLISEEYRRRSHAVRNRLSSVLDVRYGDHPDERLDIFFPARTNMKHPIHMFVHGGYWRADSKENYSFVANPIVAAGAIAAVVGYSRLPMARMAELVDQTRRAMIWLQVHAADFDGDQAAFSASGHSAGAHLASFLSAESHKELMTERIKPRSLLLVSGVFALDPLRTSFLQSEIGLTADEAGTWSPLTARPHRHTKIMLAVGERETFPFHEQARDYVAYVNSVGGAASLEILAGTNHMDIVLALGTPGTSAARLLQECIALSRRRP